MIIINKNNYNMFWFWIFTLAIAGFALVLLCMKKYGSFVACLALIVSVVGLILSQNNMQKTIEEQTHHNIISQRPLLQFFYDWDVSKVSLYLNNGGLGLAKIVSFTILNQGNESDYRNLLELIDDQIEKTDFDIQRDTLFGATPESIVLLPGKDYTLFEINYREQWHLEHMLDLTSLFEGYTIKVEYIDVYDLDNYEKDGKDSVQRLFSLERPVLKASPEMVPTEVENPDS